MRILLSNDDGYQAPGLRCLHQHLQALDSIEELVVVAPERDRSAASNSLTLDQPLRVGRAQDGFQHVSGTPTDSVHVALTGLLDDLPDLVIAGINHGTNMGDDVLYSGTVAAAMEGRFLGLPAIAVSLVIKDYAADSHHYETAAQVVVQLLSQLKNHPFPEKTILNVNVPDVPFEEIRGIKGTRLGHRHIAKPVIQQTDPRGEMMYWIGPPGDVRDMGDDTDFAALAQGYASVTPLHTDLTCHAVLPGLHDWLSPT